MIAQKKARKVQEKTPRTDMFPSDEESIVPAETLALFDRIDNLLLAKDQIEASKY